MADDPNQEDKKDIQPEFKKPVLVGRIGKLPKKAKPDAEIPEQKNEEKVKEPQSTTEQSKNSLPPAVLLKEISSPIPYKEPKWSGLCPDGSDYALEVLKSGCIVEKIDLTKKPYYVFGRLANCDVIMAHPTISRHHCVLQYKAFAEDKEPVSGWYIYDLGSTHGTFLNKERLKPSHYTRLRVGHQIKFGTSTRTYIVLGPDFDCEGESELTVTEIKEKAETLRIKRDRVIQHAKEESERLKQEEDKKREQQGIDWGMGEDAEDEPDLSDNPFAIPANEELYLDDPKKTLRGYFEREGFDLEYDCQDRGHGQYICRVELPIDDARGRSVIAEAIHTGKKKDAVLACALEACRILDRAGVLRQATHEPRQRRGKDWQADDYYDSDDDTFLDRTGVIERKRNARMMRNGDDDKPMGYDDLLKKIQEIEAKISAEEKTLERLRSTYKSGDKQTDSETDALDEFMNSLQTSGQSMATKAEISRTKMNIQKLKTELSKTHRLADIARPAHLPPLIKKDEHKMVKINSVVYGKRIKLKEGDKRPKPKSVEKKEIEDFVEEVDSDEEMENTTKSNDNGQKSEISETITNSEKLSEKLNNSEDSVHLQKDKEDRLQKQKEDSISQLHKKTVTETQKEITDSSRSQKEAEDRTKSVVEDSRTKKVYGPMRPPENYVIPDDYYNQESDRDLPEIMEKE